MSELIELQKRMATLEAQQRRWKKCCLVSILISTVLIGAMAAAPQFGQSLPDPMAPPPTLQTIPRAPHRNASHIQGIIEAREFRVVNMKNEVACRLGFYTNNHPFLAFYDTDGREVLLVQVDMRENPQVFLRHGEGTPGVSIGYWEDDIAHVELYNKQSQRNIALGGKSGSPDGGVWRMNSSSLTEVD